METVPQVEALSVTDKFVGLIAEPAPTFTNIRDAGGRVSDWLLPLIGLVVIIVAGTLLRFNDPAYRDVIMKKQTAAMEERVRTGQMSREQADQVSESMESMGSIQKIITAVSVAFGVPIVFFLVALLYWVIVKFALKGDITYALLLSVYGLTAWIGIMDQIVALLLGYATGNMFATFSPSVFMTPDFTSSMWKLMSALNPITLWSYWLFALGLSIVAKISRMKAMVLVFGLWLAYTLGAAFISFPGMG